MHEAGIIQSVLTSAEEAAHSAGAVQITVIRLRIGKLTGVVDEALQHAFQVLKLNTIASGSILEVSYITGKAWCASCRKEFTTDDLLCICPVCGTSSLDITSVMEMNIVTIDVN